MSFEEKKNKILKMICKVMDQLDPSKVNSQRYIIFFKTLDEKGLKRFITLLKEKKEQIFIVFPNMKMNLEMEDIKKASVLTKTELTSRVWLVDEFSGKKYLTNERYPILKMSVRRMQQFLDNKLKVPNDDKSIDGLTGQVSGADGKASFSVQETRVLHSRGLDKSLVELLKIRGGDIDTYGEFRRQLEETGSCNTENITSQTRVKSAHTLNVLLRGMHLDNNF